MSNFRLFPRNHTFKILQPAKLFLPRRSLHFQCLPSHFPTRKPSRNPRNQRIFRFKQFYCPFFGKYSRTWIQFRHDATWTIAILLRFCLYSIMGIKKWWTRWAFINHVDCKNRSIKSQNMAKKKSIIAKKWSKLTQMSPKYGQKIDFRMMKRCLNVVKTVKKYSKNGQDWSLKTKTLKFCPHSLWISPY